MSRIGREIITVPAGVEITVAEGNVVTVKGPLGVLTQPLASIMTIEVSEGTAKVIRPDDGKEARSLHGLTRTLLNNMVVGVTEGFKKTLEVNGVGYRAEKKGTQVMLKIGYSHDVIIEETDEIKIDVPTANQLVIRGIDKQLVGQFAADVRSKRPPEPYKGKGIKYDYEIIRRKEGKSGSK